MSHGTSTVTDVNNVANFAYWAHVGVRIRVHACVLGV